jgi:AraC-like DNA-binding protein
MIFLRIFSCFSVIFMLFHPAWAEDSIPPSGKITKPEPYTVFTSNVIRFQAEASDNESGVAAVSFFVEYTDEKWQIRSKLIGTDTTFPYEVVYDCSGIPDQDMTRLNFYLEIKDRANNVAREVDRTRLKCMAIDRNPKLSDIMLVSQRTSRPIKVDGDLDEWNLDIHKGNPTFSSSTSKTWIRSAWNGRFLYFGIFVSDEYLFVPDSFLTIRTGRLPIWLGDHIELNFDPLNIKSSYKLGVPEVLVSATSNIAGYWDNVKTNPVGAVSWGETIRHAVQTMGSANNNQDVDTGFAIEVAIPWSELKIKPAHNRAMGFDAFNRDYVDKESEPLFSSLSGVKVQQNDNPSEWALLLIIDPLYKAKVSGITLAIILAVILTLFYINRIRKKTKAAQALSKSKESHIVSSAKEYIKQNYMKNDLKLADIAKNVGLSERYFSQIFKRNTGIPPMDLLNQVRVEKAKNLLQDKTRNISEIAMEVGFGTVSNFNIVFKKISGKTPSQYRIEI